MNDDTSLMSKFGLVQGGRAEQNFEELDIKPKDYRPYAVDSQVRPSNAMIDFWLASGNQRAIAYTHLYDVEYDPSKGLVLSFSDHVITVAGRMLGELYRGLKRHRIVYIWEADPPTVRLTPPKLPVITEVVIQNRRELFEASQQG